MSEFVTIKKVDTLPRIPLEGHIDLTYRCNNNCLHCWLWRPANAPEQKDELTFDEIKDIVDQARAMGTRKWGISGGEPMLRPDFPEIFEYITSKAVSYSLNTNGTLITPAIAQQLKRKGNKMIALYGATAETYDKVTRHPGGFEMAMQGFRYMQEAGAGFVVQLIPMKANWHEWEQMKELAQSLSQDWRVGASWLYMSAYGDKEKNKEIEKQRLEPRDLVIINNPTNLNSELSREESNKCGQILDCIKNQRQFYIDPFGDFSFCSFVKDKHLQYKLRKGTFSFAWNTFLPSLPEVVESKFSQNTVCFTCQKRTICNWCGVYSYLEYGNYSTEIPYLCAIAKETELYLKDWPMKHEKYFKIADITIKIKSDIDLSKIDFRPEFSSFIVNGPGDDNITLTHFFELPKFDQDDLGNIIYNKVPWVISKKNGNFYFHGITSDGTQEQSYKLAIFSEDYSYGTIYNTSNSKELVEKHGWPSLSLLSTDQIWLAPYLADRMGAIIHSAGAIINGKGFLFVGHSTAGKSTTVEMLKNSIVFNNEHNHLEILCDDRNIVRYHKNAWHIYGTWSHGDIPDVSSSSAPLQAILFIKQDQTNQIIPISDKNESLRILLATIIKPVLTTDWWKKELDILTHLVETTPCYYMRCDKSGEIIPEILKLTS